MADDIDDLLREVEEKYLPETGASSQKKTNSFKETGRAHSDLASHELEDDLSDLLDDRLQTTSLRCKYSPRRSISAKELYNSTEKQKCFPVYVSGVIDVNAVGAVLRPCSHLRCTRCDFRVGQFNHFKWRPGTDYLFLRNHMPEFDRVRVKLAAAKMRRAYACQCRFITVRDLIDLSKLGPDFASWVCSGY